MAQKKCLRRRRAAYSESVSILVLPMGYARRLAQIDPNFNSVASMRSITKSD